MANTYSEKLKDPRWQEMREHIFGRDHYTCRLCHRRQETDVILVLHHRAYLKGKEPWDYPNEYLITLCNECHEAEHGYSGGIVPYGLPGIGEDPEEEFFEYSYGRWIKAKSPREIAREVWEARFIFEDARLESWIEKPDPRPVAKRGSLIHISKVLVHG